MNVTRDGASTPSSPSTRTVSSLLVGSTIRPSTSARNASSGTADNPSAAYSPPKAFHRSSELVDSTTAAPAAPDIDAAPARPDLGISRSNTCWSACSRSLAVSSSSAGSA